MRSKKIVDLAIMYKNRFYPNLFIYYKTLHNMHTYSPHLCGNALSNWCISFTWFRL